MIESNLFRRLSLLLCLAALPGIAGCSSAYYKAWETLGYEKRDLLKSEVADARDEQAQARDQFKSTLERFQAVTGFQGGDLEAKYRQLRDEYEDSAAQAAAVSKQINDVEQVGNDLFSEWAGEVGQMQNPELKSKNQRLMDDTRVKFDQLVATMRKSEASMKPVLTAFNDQVLFLKGNLNAQAISSLQGTAVQIEGDVSRLIAQMDAAISEADAFIKQLGS
jgi:ElaB/YqjD/DUF883 family membrane-anchored ribosome-binding protein